MSATTTANVWDVHAAGGWVVIPTNQQTRTDGTAVMGAGLAKDAAERFPALPGAYGLALSAGRTCMAYPTWRILCVAVPALGCGHGTLAWTDVEPLLGRLPNPPFLIHPPQT